MKPSYQKNYFIGYSKRKPGEEIFIGQLLRKNGEKKK